MRALVDFEIEHWLSLRSIARCGDPSVPCYKTQEELIHEALNSPFKNNTRPLYMCLRFSGSFRWAQIFASVEESSYVGRILPAAVRLSACQVSVWWSEAFRQNCETLPLQRNINSVAQVRQPLIAVFQSSYTSWACRSNNVSGFNNDGSGLSASYYGPPVKVTLNLWMFNACRCSFLYEVVNVPVNPVFTLWVGSRIALITLNMSFLGFEFHREIINIMVFHAKVRAGYCVVSTVDF